MTGCITDELQDEMDKLFEQFLERDDYASASFDEYIYEHGSKALAAAVKEDNARRAVAAARGAKI